VRGWREASGGLNLRKH